MEWIAVADQLPPDREYVVLEHVTSEKSYVYIGEYHEDVDTFYANHTSYPRSEGWINYWLALPPAPIVDP